MFKGAQVKIINLDSRPERFQEVLTELPKIGITEYNRFSAIVGGAQGCDFSHRECLKGEGPLLILEDDVIFEENALQILLKAFYQLPEDYDMFYLGANVKTPAKRYSNNLFKINGGTHTTHAILYSTKGRQRIQDIWEPCKYHTIDNWLFMEGQGLLNCYVCWPIQAFQRPCYSDIRLQWFDYKEEMLANQKANME